MTKLYKLTTSDNRTRPCEDNECQWGENVTHSGTGEGDLCGPGYIHAYTDPLLAVLLNPIHGDYPNPNLWECKGRIAKRDGQLKVGCVTLTTVKQIELPKITNEQRVKFAILCAKQVCTDPAWNKWTDNWLSGADRTAEAATEATARAAWATEAAEAASAARAAARAASAAAEAAEAAGWAAARVAAEAARAAAWAAWAAAEAAADIDLAAIAKAAITETVEVEDKSNA